MERRLRSKEGGKLEDRREAAREEWVRGGGRGRQHGRTPGSGQNRRCVDIGSYLKNRLGATLR